jgi:hypothetical protein
MKHGTTLNFVISSGFLVVHLLSYIGKIEEIKPRFQSQRKIKGLATFLERKTKSFGTEFSNARSCPFQ